MPKQKGYLLICNDPVRPQMDEHTLKGMKYAAGQNSSAVMAWHTGAAIAFLSVDDAQSIIKKFRSALRPGLQMFACEVGPDCSGCQIPSLPSVFHEIKWLKERPIFADED